MAATSTYSVHAFNISHASENKIHDDAVAQKLGFTGGLVPGVEVFAYASHPVVQKWGRAWLERGQMEARFLKPVYDGRTALVTATESGDKLELKVESEGVLCATGTASLAASTPTAPSIAAYQERKPPEAGDRPPADETSLAAGTSTALEQLNYCLPDSRATACDDRNRAVHASNHCHACSMLQSSKMSSGMSADTRGNGTSTTSERCRSTHAEQRQ